MQVIIALNSYDDLFSDFDIRGYDERPFSRDFLDELNLRMIKLDSNEKIEVTLLVPEGLRNESNESVILKRMSGFFSDRYAHYRRKNKNTIIKSAVFVIIGLLLMFIANFFTEKIPAAFGDFLLIPSWYFVWSGLEQFVESREGIKDKIRYYSKLTDVVKMFKNR